MKELLLRQWFVLALVGAVFLAFQIPEWGSSGGPLKSEITTELGMVLIFFFQGWVLPTEVLAKCMLQWKAHLFTQCFVFVIFPCVVLLGDLFWAPFMPQSLRLGFFFLAVLPTTITSAIIYTSQAGGNVAVALLNTTVANVAGVLITPLWMTILVSAGSGETGDLGSVLLKLSKLILLPFFAGQLAHRFWKSAVPVIKTPAGYLNQAIIVFIVFSAFSNSVTGGVWDGQGASLVAITTVLCLAIFGLVMLFSAWGAQALKLGLADQAAVFFCGTQKTLAAAVPLGISLFGMDPAFGIILLPVMVYHPIQLILGAFFIGYFKKRVAGGKPA